MAFVESIATDILTVVLDWLQVALIIMLFYALWRLFAGGSEGGGRWPWSSDPERDEPDPRTPRKPRTRPEGEDESEDVRKTTPKTVGLDNEHPGRVRVYVSTADHNPVPNARFTIYGLNMGRIRRFFRRMMNRQTHVYTNRTGPDGYFPAYVEGIRIGSGPVRVVVRSRLGDGETEEFIHPWEDGQEPQLIHVVLDRRGEESQGFEPRIIDVQRAEDRTLLRGVVE